ncbi:unnamed protein product [Rodentolepis nana]|uniref:DUF4203 domain-containing protein n=1 Tax=Rodentolepis nana TaxID=102285 RepID=A0A158QGQ3_RODNA|nr:unnamed protein product [Rodentolepis nana]
MTAKVLATPLINHKSFNQLGMYIDFITFFSGLFIIVYFSINLADHKMADKSKTFVYFIIPYGILELIMTLVGFYDFSMSNNAVIGIYLAFLVVVLLGQIALGVLVVILLDDAVCGTVFIVFGVLGLLAILKSFTGVFMIMYFSFRFKNHDIADNLQIFYYFIIAYGGFGMIIALVGFYAFTLSNIDAIGIYLGLLVTVLLGQIVLGITIIIFIEDVLVGIGFIVLGAFGFPAISKSMLIFKQEELKEEEEEEESDGEK